MGIWHTRGPAEAAKNIDRPHIDVHHVIPFGYRQFILAFRKAEITGGIGIIKVLGRIQPTFKPIRSGSDRAWLLQRLRRPVLVCSVRNSDEWRLAAR